jgi:fructokinase
VPSIYGGVETGGTWVVCALGTSPDDIVAQETFATGEPGPTLARVAAFFERGPRPAAIGVGSFGPVDLDPQSATWGHVTSTPKPGWAHTPVAPVLRERLGIPVAFETDVTAAALGEHRWGAATGVHNVCYVTIGTGIGAGLLIGGRPVHGLIHPEVGHLLIRHNSERDPFAGACPRHGDCWEGLAAGGAIAERWGADARELPDDHEAWALEADYVAQGILAIVLVVSPERIVAGGGVMERPGLLAAVRNRMMELNAGYLESAMLGDRIDEYVVAPALGDRAGALGALALAQASGR